MSHKLLLRCANLRKAPPWCNPQTETLGEHQLLLRLRIFHLPTVKFQSQNQEVTYTVEKIKNGPKLLLLLYLATLLLQASNTLFQKTLTYTLSLRSQPPQSTFPPTVSPPTLSAVPYVIGMSSFSSGNSAFR